MELYNIQKTPKKEVYNLQKCELINIRLQGQKRFDIKVNFILTKNKYYVYFNIRIPFRIFQIFFIPNSFAHNYCY